MIDPRYRELTCYNFGESGHFMGICEKPKVCFICAISGHYMDACPNWKELPIATYMWSVGTGLGFYHIELPEVQTTRWLNINNCGVVVIKRGSISLVELEKELSKIFCRDWPWQIRELTLARFLVRYIQKVSSVCNMLMAPCYFSSMIWSLLATGIKINYHQSDLVPINPAEEETQIYARTFCCKLGSFPFKYLGVHLHHEKLRREDIQHVVDQIMNTIPGWQGRLISYAARLALLKAYLAHPNISFISN
jgi:hypothetical protein